MAAAAATSVSGGVIVIDVGAIIGTGAKEVVKAAFIDREEAVDGAMGVK